MTLRMTRTSGERHWTMGRVLSFAACIASMACGDTAAKDGGDGPGVLAPIATPKPGDGAKDLGPGATTPTDPGGGMVAPTGAGTGDKGMGTAGAGATPPGPNPATEPGKVDPAAMVDQAFLDAQNALYPERFHNLLYNPTTHLGAAAGTGLSVFAGISAPSGAELALDDCTQNPPTQQQAAAVNKLAVETAMFMEKLPIFANKAAAEAPGGVSAFGMSLPFSIAGLEALWDVSGWHYPVTSAVADGQQLNGMAPENVVYIQTDQGFRPIGAMLMPTNGTAPGPDIGGCLTYWHVHDAAGPLGEGLGYMMHVYTYGNPAGPATEPLCGPDFRICASAVPNQLNNPKR